ncbi:MAG: hypothetical protein IJU23_05130 [Proteobacteria bacterium]|nr:hypothetical protein [Pseudomonadota bacterium]
MKKVIIGLSIALLAFGAMGCKKEKKVQAASAGASEQILSLEVMAQLNDPAASDASAALTCKYVSVSGSSMSVGEVKTSGSCDWSAVKSSAAASGSLNSAAAAKIVSIISADSSLPANVKDKWDCKAINITTNLRQVGAQDCADGSGVSDATAKSISAALGL